MLREILRNFSTSDCFELLSEKQQRFYNELSLEQRESFDLINVVYENLGIMLLSDKKICTKIVGRLRPEQLKQAFANLSIDADELTKPYQIMEEIIDNDPSDFIKALNVFDDYASVLVSTSPMKSTTQVEPEYPLYPYQIDCSQRIRSLIKDNTANRAMLHLPTGAGKTRTAINIICDFLRVNPEALVIWLADTRELCDQALAEFRKAWKVLGNQSMPSYAYYGDSELSISGISRGFFVAGLQKLNAMNNNDKVILQILYQQLKKHTSLVVFDEAHKAIAPTYKNTVESFIQQSLNNAFLLGLSATPGRVMTDDIKLQDENKRLSAFFNNNKVAMRIKGYNSPIEYLVEDKYLAKANFIQLDYDDIELSAFTISERRSEGNAELLKALSINSNRNSKIIDTIQLELANENAQIIVFACTVDHADELSMILAGSGIACRKIDGNTPSILRAAAVSDYRRRKIRVLINYGVLTAGFDAPCTDVAIIARPTASLVQYSQMAGRAMRGQRSGGNLSCRIYTVNDNIPEFRSVCHAFAHWDSMWSEE
ncbi:DEAD/DEAH box helicase [Citrobacter sp. Cb014]|uniref:DEAD/DEAH box helicase n=1 Tax=Citrobacter sp. Cb014 TaxID=2985014 RepID=UPI0025810B65|nr:DEAD/DEAH box helicase [Citrobacter sp. Cb014]MDM3391794.1 DEAD/DEAH box helicase [Citrobacter sp. Cb014]